VTVDDATNASWHVHFFKIISVKYVVLDLDPNYQWVLVGHPSRRYGWIMARTKTMDEGLYQRILSAAGQQGYDTAKFQKVPQQPSEAGAAAPAGAMPQH
jgi:apolipoprotein D and lipocalin family protein